VNGPCHFGGVAVRRRLGATAGEQAREAPHGAASKSPPGGVADITALFALAARFLDHTDYNPHGYGTHIALGDGPPGTPRRRTGGPGPHPARAGG
jgi:hypothetical protein